MALNKLKRIFKNTANAIREKKGSTDLLKPEDFKEEILNIETGITPSGTLEITENGEYDVTEKVYVNVNVPTSSGGGSIEVPPVTNLTVVEDILTFTKPDVTELINNGAIISYLVTINEATIEVEDSGIDIIDLLNNPINNISVRTKAVFNSIDSNVISISKEETLSVLNVELPVALSSCGLAAIDSKIYVLGGYDGSARVNTIYELDLINNAIHKLDAVLPKSFNGMISYSYNNLIYIMGGYDGSNRVKNIYKFDTTTGTVTTLSANTSGLSGVGFAKESNYLYLIGGQNSSSSGSHSNIISQFDAISETFTTLNATLPIELTNLSCCSINGYVYIFGGRDSYPEQNIYKFDTTTGTVTTLSTKLPVGLQTLSSNKIGNNIYIFGGQSANGKVDTIYKFNSTNDTIELLNISLPTASTSIPTVSVNNRILLLLDTPSKVIYTFS